MPSVLTLDVGNTSLKGVLWEGGRVLRRFRWMRQGQGFSLDGEDPLPLGEVAKVIGLASRGLALEHGIPGCPPGVWVGRDLPPPLRVDYDAPGEMGWDRRVAALALHQESGAGFVLDAGTCLTLTHVDSEGLCRGFGIAPGLAALAGALGAFAPNLSRDLRGLPETYPRETRSTEDNLRAGVWASFLGSARELLELGRERLEASGVSPGPLVLTGSDGGLLGKALGEGRLDPLLVHRGLLSLAGEGG